MSTLLQRLGGLAHRRPWPFIVIWILLLGGVLGLAATSGGSISSSMTIDGTPSQEVIDQLQEELPQASGGQGTIVFTVPEGERLDTGESAAAIADAASRISAMDEVVQRPAQSATGQPNIPNTPDQGAQPPASTDQGNQPPPNPNQGMQEPAGPTPPYTPLIADDGPVAGVLVSLDGRVAMLQMQFTSQVDELPDGTTDEVVTIAKDAVAGTDVTALQSDSLDPMHPPIGGHEVIGLAIALVVLLITLGSLRAAGLPILTALIGVAIGIGGAFALSTSITLTSSTPALALMVGLAVGIDYALFVVNRQRRLIMVDGLSAPKATARALATAGSAVVFAGATVVIALTGMTVIGIGFLSTMALVAASTVALAVLIAITLLPALLGLVGERIVSDKARTTGQQMVFTKEHRFANKWVRFLVRRPRRAVASVVVILGLAAVPALGMELGMPTGANEVRESTSRQSYDAITRGFGEGFNAPLVVVVHPTEADTLNPQDLGAVTSGLQQNEGIAWASLMGADPDRSVALFNVIPEQGPDDQQTHDLVEILRGPDALPGTDANVDLGVTGLTAINLDITDRLSEALPTYITIIVGLSLLLLLLVFRSVLVPIKATVGFLLSIAATFGITTAVFQWGWFIEIVGLDKGGPLLSFMPIVVTGILYGLAMDYQVFLVSSMREAQTHGKTARRSIIHGFDHSSRVVVAAAVIMVSVFASFIFTDEPMIKQFGFTLAVGVLIDAFLVRMTLVPAVMSLLGEKAWWIPRWLDRMLPTVDIEGEGRAGEPEPRHAEAVGARRAKAAEPVN